MQIQEIREAFHSISNYLNNISIQAGTKAALSRRNNVDTMDNGSLRDALKEALETLSSVEASALRAGETLIELKKKIYALLKIDTSKPLKKKEDS